MEVMPNLLARRSFKPPATLRMVQPGYRDAPDINKCMAIVFCKVGPRGRKGGLVVAGWRRVGRGAKQRMREPSPPALAPNPSARTPPPPQVEKPSAVVAAEAPTERANVALIGVYQVRRRCGARPRLGPARYCALKPPVSPSNDASRCQHTPHPKPPPPTPNPLPPPLPRSRACPCTHRSRAGCCGSTTATSARSRSPASSRSHSGGGTGPVVGGAGPGSAGRGHAYCLLVFSPPRSGPKT
jgi:hypothetical protein